MPVLVVQEMASLVQQVADVQAEKADLAGRLADLGAELTAAQTASIGGHKSREEFERLLQVIRVCADACERLLQVTRVCGTPVSACCR